MVSDWGGMTFLIPYVLFVVLIGASGVIEEMALGRAAKGGPIKAFGCCTEIRTGKLKPGEIVGVIPVLGSLALAIGYTVVVGWIFKYAFLAISGGLFQFHQDMDAIAGLFGSTASAFGNNMWLVIAMVATLLDQDISETMMVGQTPLASIVTVTYQHLTIGLTSRRFFQRRLGSIGNLDTNREPARRRAAVARGGAPGRRGGAAGT